MVKTVVDKSTGEIVEHVEPGYRLPRQPGKYDVIQACEECCVHDFGPTMTQQNQAEEADINTIVRRFGLTGQLPENIRLPQYGDFTEVMDYQSAQNAIVETQAQFMKMPAGLRAMFNNDPQDWLEFSMNPDNAEKLVQLGLAKRREENDDGKQKIAVGGGGTPTQGIPQGNTQPGGTSAGTPAVGPS